MLASWPQLDRPATSMFRDLRRLADADTRELLGAGGSALAIRVVSLAVAYGFTLVVGRSLGAEAWGGFTLALATLLMGGVLARLGVDTAVLRLVAETSVEGGETREVLAPAVALVMPWAIVVTGGLYVASDVVAESIFRNPELRGALEVAALGVPSLALSQLVTQALRGLRRVRTYILLEQFTRFAFPLMVLPWMIDAQAGAVEVTVAYVVGTYLTTGCALLAWRAVAPSTGASRTRPRELLEIGLPLLLANSMDYLKGWVDVLMLGIFVTEAEVGRYNISRRLASLVSLPLVALNSIAAPRFAELWGSRNRTRLEHVSGRSALIAFSVGVPIALVLASTPIWWLGLFGADFRAGSSALRILVVGYLISTLVGSVGYLLQMCGLQKAFQYITVFVAGLGVVLNYLLIPRIGIEGAALSTAIGVAAWNAGALVLVRLRLGFWSLPFTAGQLGATDARE